MANITILGTPGAGKTVFLTVLAKRYEPCVRGRQVRYPWLRFKNAQTGRFVATNWDRLNKGDWPPSTPPGTFPELEWDLHLEDGSEHNLKVIDSAGQDMKAIFNPQGTPSQEQNRLLQKIRESDVLFLLINLGDVIKAQTSTGHSEINIPVQMVLQDAIQQKTSVGILFSQTDSLVPYLQKKGFSGIKEAISKYLPGVYATVENTEKETFKIFSISAVAETRLVTEKDGNTRAVPQNQFKSEGFEDVLEWLGERLKNEEREKVGKEKYRQFTCMITTIIIWLVYYGLCYWLDKPQRQTVTESTGSLTSTTHIIDSEVFELAWYTSAVGLIIAIVGGILVGKRIFNLCDPPVQNKSDAEVMQNEEITDNMIKLLPSAITAIIIWVIYWWWFLWSQGNEKFYKIHEIPGWFTTEIFYKKVFEMPSEKYIIGFVFALVFSLAGGYWIGGKIHDFYNNNKSKKP